MHNMLLVQSYKLLSNYFHRSVWQRLKFLNSLSNEVLQLKGKFYYAVILRL